MADRYWVGGNANWDATAGTKWALTSNGAGGQAVPTAADDVYFDGGSGAVTCTISGSRVAQSINCTGFTGTLAGTAAPTLAISGSLTLDTGMTLTYAGTTTFNATGTITSAGKTLGAVTVNGAGITITLGDALTSSGNFTLTQGALDLNDKTLSCFLFSSNNSNTRSIAFGTLGQINLTGNSTTLWSFPTLTNFSFTGTSKVNLTANATTGTRGVQHGQTAGGSESLTFNFNVTAGSDTITIISFIRNLDFTGFSGTMPAFSVGNQAIYGNLTLSPTMTVGAGAGAMAFSSTTQTQIITTNGVTLDCPMTLNGTQTYQLGSALTMGSTRTITLTTGTFNAGIYNVTTGVFGSNNSNTRTLTMGSGTWTLTGTGTVWNFTTTTNLTLNANTSQINTTSTSTKTFAGGGRTYYNLSNAGSGTLTITGSNTYNNLSALGGCPLTIASATTQSANTFTFQGASSVTIAPSSTTNYTLTKLGGGIVDMQNVSISRCTANPSTGTWYAGASTDGGNNTGIRFVSAPKFMAVF